MPCMGEFISKIMKKLQTIQNKFLRIALNKELKFNQNASSGYMDPKLI